MLDFGFYNMDCMDGMRQFPDKYFDLAIVDPPYGGAGQEFEGTDGTRFGGRDGTRFGGRFERYSTTFKVERRGAGHNKCDDKIVNWDVAPSQEYFDELLRVSKNVVIWGGNYFSLPPCRCFLIWEKTNMPENFSMAMCEYAWTNINDNAKIFKKSSLRDNTSGKFHPTEKPIDLYKWILAKYANPGDKILDTHVGSASSLIACYQMQMRYVGFEIDEEYYKKASKRLAEEMAQVTIFDVLGDM